MVNPNSVSEVVPAVRVQSPSIIRKHVDRAVLCYHGELLSRVNLRDHTSTAKPNMPEEPGLYNNQNIDRASRLDISPALNPQDPWVAVLRTSSHGERSGTTYFLKAPEEKGVVWMSDAIHGDVTRKAAGKTGGVREIRQRLSHLKV